MSTPLRFSVQAINIIALFFLFLPNIHSRGCAAATEPGTHPAYRNYDFGDSKTVVRFGTQPLGVLSAVVPEIMMRDRLLQNYLKAHQMELRTLPFYNGPDINHFMRKGKVDLAMAGDFPTMTMATVADIEVVAIAKRDKAAVVSSGKYSTLLDLKGKRIAFPAGTSSHLGLLVVMEAAGLRESDMKMIPMNIEKVTGALLDGKIDAFAGWEPIPSAALALNEDFKIISQFLNTDFLYWTEAFSREKDDIARHVLAAYFRAIYWLNLSDANLTLGTQWSFSGTERFLGKQSKLTFEELKQRIRENLALAGSAAIPENEFDDGSYLNRAFNLLKKKGQMNRLAEWSRVKKSLRADLINELLERPKEYQILKFDYDVE